MNLKEMMMDRFFDEDIATTNINYLRIIALTIKFVMCKLKGKLGSVCFFKTSVLESI